MSIPITEGGANVFADLGLPDAEEMLVKAQLAQQIARTIQSQCLTQSVAASRMGIGQPKLSNILRGKFQGISEDRLMRCLAALGHNVTIVLSRADKACGTVEVACRHGSAIHSDLLFNAPRLL